MRRLVSLVVSVILVISLAVPAFAATVSLAGVPAAVEAGEEFVVSVSLDESIENVTGYQYHVYFNTNLFEYVGKESGLHATVGSKVFNDDVGSYIKLTYVDATSEGVTVSADAPIAKLTFKAKADIQASEDTSFTLTKKFVSDSVTNGKIEDGAISTTGGSASVTVTPATVKYDGYAVYASSDVTTTNGGTATIQLFATHSDKDKQDESAVKTYNAYDITLTYDKNKLTLSETFGGAAAGENAQFTHDAQNGTLRIAGYGADKQFTEAIAELTFTMNGNGAAEVTIGETKMAASQAAIQDAPVAAKSGGSDATHDKAIIKVPYTVILPDDFTGKDTVLPGEDYTFTAPGNWFEKVLVSIGGGEAVEIEPDAAGGLTYTITGVNGNVVITAVGKTYHVTATAGTGATVDIGDKNTAQYGVDYTFTAGVTSGAMKLNITIAGASYTSYSISGSMVTIPGKDIKGDIAINVTAESNATNITFDAPDGVVVGGNNQMATNGVDFIFRLNTEDSNDYVVMLGSTTLNPDTEGNYTIPGEMINGSPLTVTVSVTEREFVMEIAEYITLNEKVMYLVMAKEGSKVLAYNGKPMYWSEKYQFKSEIEAQGEEAPAGAYCWLVITDETVKAIDDVKTAAMAAIAEAADESSADRIAYDFDVNQTGVVDINDAQLTYNMYQAKMYEDFESVTMDEFLEADLNNDKLVDSLDAIAVVNNLLGLEAENENTQSNASEQN